MYSQSQKYISFHIDTNIVCSISSKFTCSLLYLYPKTSTLHYGENFKISVVYFHKMKLLVNISMIKKEIQETKYQPNNSIISILHSNRHLRLHGSPGRKTRVFS